MGWRVVRIDPTPAQQEAQRYRRKAKECVATAETMHERAARQDMLEIAGKYQTLARRLERTAPEAGRKPGR